MRTSSLLVLLLLAGTPLPLSGCATTLGPPEYTNVSSPLARSPLASQDSLRTLRAERLFVRGMTHLTMDEPERARGFFGEALDLAPNEPAILSALADVALRLDDPNTAVFYAEQATRLAPDQPAYLVQLASAQRSAGRLDAARATLDRLLAEHPDDRAARAARSDLSESSTPTDPEAVVMRVGPNEGTGDLEQLYDAAIASKEDRARAVTQLEAEIARDETAARSRFMLGHLLLLEGRASEAAAHLGQSVALDPRLLEAWPLAVSAHRQAGDVQAAAATLDEGLLLFPSHPPLLLAGIDLALDQGDVGRAVDRLDALTRVLDETDAALWTSAGEAAARIAEAAPDDARALHLAGWTQYQSGQAEQALPLLERAAEVAPRDVLLYEHLGDVRMALGNWSGAVAAWNRALEVQPNRESIRLKLREANERYGAVPKPEND